ncbi:MAG TPA: FAD:protein FMN transferase [Roseimicrobium sp.]|nr:FAD:protein FMN transferase [Roseimicrobium sp.]
MALPVGAGESVIEVQWSGRALGTTYAIRFVRDGSISLKDHERGVSNLLERLEQQASTYRTNSELSLFNASRQTNWFPVSKELAEIVVEAQRISALSDGAFDITVDPLVRLWGFGPQGHAGEIPSASAIHVAKAHVGFRNLEVITEPPALRKMDPELTIDLSAIAKGYCVDAVGRYLEQGGVTRYLVEIGGEVRARGLSAANRPWHLGIEKPVDGVREIGTVVALADMSMATSGDYRNSFVIGKKRYAHIIDPKTGWPAARNVASVSVVHSSCMTADAWATALSVMGAERGLVLAEQEGLACLFVERNGEVIRPSSNASFEAVVVKK